MGLGRIAMLALLPILAGCGLLGLGDERVIGEVDFEGDEPDWVIVPDSVDALSEFSVTLLTAGGGCSKVGDTEVEVRGTVFLITPYDIQVSGECLTIFTWFDHSVTLRAPRSGPAEVRIRAREYPNGPLVERSFPVVVR